MIRFLVFLVCLFCFSCSNFALFPKKEKGLTSDTDRFACQEALELNALNMKYMSLSAILIAFLLGLNQAHSPGWRHYSSHVQKQELDYLQAPASCSKAPAPSKKEVKASTNCTNSSLTGWLKQSIDDGDVKTNKEA